MAVIAKFNADDARDMREQFVNQKLQRQLDSITDRFKRAIAEGTTTLFIPEDVPFAVTTALREAGFTVDYDYNGDMVIAI